MSVQSMGEMGKDFRQIFSNLFLKTLTAGSVFQYFTTLTENATLSFDGGSHEVRNSIPKTREYLE